MEEGSRQFLEYLKMIKIIEYIACLRVSAVIE